MLTILIIALAIVFYPHNIFFKTQQKKNHHNKSIIFMDTARDDDKSKQYTRYLTATYLHSSGELHNDPVKIKKALENYKKFFSQAHSLYPYGDYFQLLSSIGQTPTLLKLYESKKEALDKTLSGNIKTQLTLAQSYLEQNQEEKAEDIYLKLSNKYPDNPQIAYFTAVALSKKKSTSQALAWIDKNLANPVLKRIHHLFHFIKSKIYLESGKAQEAQTEIDQCLTLSPKFDKALLLKALMFEQQGKVDDAIKGYQHFLDIVGRDSSVEKQLIQLLFMQKRFGQALNYVKKMRTQSPDHFFNVALIEFRAGHYDHALQFIEQAIEKDPSLDKARLLKAEILLGLDKVEDLFTFLESWIISDPKKPNALHTLLLLRKTQIPASKIITLLQSIEKKHASVLILAALADLFTEQKDYKKSIDYYNKIAAQTKDAAIKSKALFQVGYTYFITNQGQKLEEVLSQAIDQESVYPSAYNLLAYYYAKTSQKLDRALNLIGTALKHVPECYYYLDTKGYILHQMGNYKQAIEVFNQALKQAPHDKVIQNHLKNAQKKQQS